MLTPLTRPHVLAGSRVELRGLAGGPSDVTHLTQLELHPWSRHDAAASDSAMSSAEPHSVHRFGQ